jgi:hypothetical protein
MGPLAEGPIASAQFKRIPAKRQDAKRRDHLGSGRSRLDFMGFDLQGYQIERGAKALNRGSLKHLCDQF